MENARHEILAAIRRNLAKSEPYDEEHRKHHAAQKSLPVLNNSLATETELKSVPQAERFKENLISIGGDCEIVKDLAEAAEIVQKIIDGKQIKRIALSDSPTVKEVRGFLKGEFEILEKVSSSKLFDCDLGITGAQFGIAETGTLVLESDREFHRLTSLVPPVHICLLEAKNLRQTLGEVLSVLEKDLSKTITFITGPSRTSDIELTLAIGVHGPAQLFVILISDN